MIYFTSDTHFYSEKIITFGERPFANLDEMHSALISNWNKLVSDKDETYILGDFMHTSSGLEANEILKALNGKKYLVRGNHDKYIHDKDFDKSNFCWVKDYYELKHNKQKFVLFHYPILEWNGYFSDAIHLHGHVHKSRNNPAQLKRLEVLGSRAVNVGADVNNYSPISIDDILTGIKK